MDVNEIIIENVKQHDCLYNLASRNYKNVQKKSDIWEGIGALVELSGDACRKRFKGLRDTYKRRKRVAQLASGSGAPSPSKKWKYKEALEFLDGCKDARATTGSVEDKENDFEFLFDCSPSTVFTESFATDESASRRNEAQAKKITKRHADEEVTTVLKEVMKECTNSVKEIAAGGASDRDSTTLLFQSLAKKILEANLPPYVVDTIEAKVVNLVYDEIAKNLAPYYGGD